MSFAVGLCFTLRIFAELFFVGIQFVFFLYTLYTASFAKAKQYPYSLLQLEKEVTSKLGSLGWTSASTSPSSNTHIVYSRYVPLVY